MKNKTNPFAIVSIIITIASLISVWLKNIDWLLWLTIIFLVVQVFLYLFNIWIWRIRIPTIRKLLPPDLNGTYHGKISYNYNGKKEKDIIVEISQTLDSIDVVVKTDQILSETVMSNLKKVGGVYHLTYTYKTNSKYNNNDAQNPESLGTADLIVENDCLQGLYWTSNKTIGKIHIEKT